MRKFFVSIKQKPVTVCRTLLGETIHLTEFRFEVFVNDIYIDTFRTYQQLQDWSTSFKYTTGKQGQIVTSFSSPDCPF